jgi:cell wall-associated NlpC family hydrolase
MPGAPWTSTPSDDGEKGDEQMTALLTPRPPASDSPIARPSRGRRHLRRRLLALAAVPLALVLAGVLTLVTLFSSGFGGLPGGGFGVLAFDPDSSAPITVNDPALAQLNQDQLHNAVKIIATGMQVMVPGTHTPLPPRAWVIALATAQQESRLTNLAGGDRDSLGLFQQRPSQGWGTRAQIRNPTYAATKFYRRLVQVPNWQTIPLTEAAQAVQRSGFPNAYAYWEPLATSLVQALVRALPSTGIITDANIRTAIDFARHQLGKPYVWGATGPNAFDCSGLTMRAWQAAGVALPRTSRDQYRAGRYLPVLLLQAGDLVFYAYDTGDPRTIHHVAMYLGNGTIIEAQQEGVPVHIRPFAFTEGELMPFAVRVTPKR